MSFRWIIFFSIFIFQLTQAAENIQVTSISELSDIKPGQQKEIQIHLKLPAGFHAYKDQFRIQNLQPEQFKAGQIQIKPEIDFYDKFSKKNRKGFKDQGAVILLIEAGDKVPDKLDGIQFDLRYQICSDSVCYLPRNLNLNVKVASATEASSTSNITESKDLSLSDRFKSSLETNLLLAFVLVFLAGILTSFTPCIFPMLPITISILGYHANKGSRGHNIARAISYVLGIALTYSMLGVVAALTGQLFGSTLTNKYVLASLCLLFVVMAFGMWGAFEIQVPAFIRNRFGTSKGGTHNLGGAFVMGLVAGIVASPCVGPVLVSILSFVSASHNVVLGFSLLFTFALGLGLIFIVIGAFSHALHLLPKSGAWMNFIKFILGAGMWIAALYYAQFLFSYRWWLAAVAASLVGLSIWQGAFSFRKKNYIRQSFFLALFVFSSSILLLSFVKAEYLSPAFSGLVEKKSEAKTEWIPYSEKAFQDAIAEGKPVLLDFYADWCGACHELEEKTYTNPEFIETAKSFKLIKFDATNDTPENQAVLQKYGVQGLPTVMFINRKGDLLKNLTFTQFIEWKDLKPLMQESLK